MYSHAFVPSGAFKKVNEQVRKTSDRQNEKQHQCIRDIGEKGGLGTNTLREKMPHPFAIR